MHSLDWVYMSRIKAKAELSDAGSDLVMEG